MITARYEPPLLFPKERTPSPHLGTSRRGCTPPPSSSSSLNDGEDIDRFMELAHAALEEATKEEDAKGVLHELVERVLVKTGAPLLAGVIAEQWRSQEVIEQLAERSFERQRRRQQQQQQRSPLSSPSVSLSANKKKRRMRPASDSTKNEKNRMILPTPHRPSSSPIQQTKPSSLFSSSSSSSSSSSTSTSTSLLSSQSLSSQSSVEVSSKDSHNPDSMEEAVTRDQFIIQQPHSLDTEHDRLLLVSEYIWRLFRLLILASLVALVYHYVCTYPHQLFLIV
ncbi:unnamed protein product [Absidia cylindrospora]